MRADEGRTAGVAAVPAGGPPGTLRSETLIVLALSLGASAVSSLIGFVGSVTKPGGLRDQTARINHSYAPDRPWLDLAWQLFHLATALVPVLLVAHLLLREGAGLRVIGLDRRRPWTDLGRGALVAAAVGSAGLAFYLATRAAGMNLTVVPAALPGEWWKYPVLVLSALQNSLVEEVVVVGYLLRRLDQLGWSPTAALAASSVLRGSYHLYQGLGGFVGNLVMGIVFVLLYRRWGRVGPLVAAHALLDVVAFVGYALLAGRVGWLPTE
ncbi:CPBP family intramembrane glutamic endopeptidase [Streptomyces somaliensis]|uniref:CPBP family intramembrane metalloprotease n=1 Tax=Streptomyces somaliensis (strain ATCC 33201 / DSM 40738 / JCM 12659 / KCTC 9044 / NCTC 11332 / NRRL B-12077 / IP 733) TaxID=1134445 RepID=A0AA44DC79_STRE0|nr:CPBP family intramembrane metalloprotease [Streptomyces somaliensis DSM 40738]